MPKYKQFLKNVFSVSTISLKSNNFKKFLKYFPCLYSRLVFCIYGDMDCLPLPYYVFYRDKTDVEPRPCTRYISLVEVMHQTKRGLKCSQVQMSGDSLRLWKRKRQFLNSDKPLLCVNDLIDGAQKFWTKLSRNQNNNRNTPQQHASERQLQNVTPSLCIGHQLNV